MDGRREVKVKLRTCGKSIGNKEVVQKQVSFGFTSSSNEGLNEELTDNKRKGRLKFQFKAQSYTEEDWDNIRAKLEANAELKEIVLRKDLTVEDYAKRMVELVLNQLRKEIEEDKDDKPIKRLERGGKQITKERFAYTDHDRDDNLKIQISNEKDDSTSDTKTPINPIPVATKSPNIANYKIIKQGRKGVYQIVRENETDMVYISFGAMLTDNQEN
ncbi:hypothetical protein Tco_0294182 [Tanacetum coccineum]